MSQLLQIAPDFSYQYEEIVPTFQISVENISIELKETAQYFFQSIDFRSHQKWKRILTGYVDKGINGGKIRYRKVEYSRMHMHNELIKNVLTFLDGYGLYKISQAKQSKKDLKELHKKIESLNGQIYSKKDKVNSNKILIIYFPKQLREIIVQLITQYDKSIKQKLIFSLNQHILKWIKLIQKSQRENTNLNIPFANFAGKFIEIIVKYYRQEIIRLPLLFKSKNMSLNLKILSIISGFTKIQNFSSSGATPNENQEGGVYGIELQLQGQESHFPLFYSVIKQFFDSLTYVVKKVDGLGIQFLEKQHLKAIYFGEYVFIFDPPQNLESIFNRMQCMQHKLSQNDFLYSDFGLFVKHKKTFMNKIRHLNLLNLKIDQNQISFQSDSKIFKVMEFHCKLFLDEMLEKKQLIPFLKTPQEVSIMKRYIKLNAENAQLFWQQDKAYINSFYKDADDIYNHLKQSHKQLIKSLIEIPSRAPIEHPLVICKQVTSNIEMTRSNRYKLINQQFYIQIKKSYQIYNERFAVFLVNNPKKCRQLNKLLQNNGVKYQCGTEILTDQQNCLQSIIVSNITNISGQISGKHEDQNIKWLIQKLIGLEKPLKIVFPYDCRQFALPFLQQFLNHAIFRRECLSEKILQLYFPQKIELETIKSNFLDEIDCLVKQSKKFERINTYYLSQQQIFKINTYEPVKLKCSDENEAITCTPINSFVFYNETQRKIQHKVCLFVPKKDTEYIEYLVYLHTLQLYQVQQHEIKKLQLNDPTLKNIINWIKSIFLMQNYLVLYYNQITKQYYTSFYVYFSKQTNKILKKKRINLVNNTIEHLQKIYSYQMDLSIIGDKYLLKTHRQFLPQLINILNKSQDKLI